MELLKTVCGAARLARLQDYWRAAGKAGFRWATRGTDSDALNRLATQRQRHHDADTAVTPFCMRKFSTGF